MLRASYLVKLTKDGLMVANVGGGYGNLCGSGWVLKSFDEWKVKRRSVFDNPTVPNAEGFRFFVRTF